MIRRTAKPKCCLKRWKISAAAKTAPKPLVTPMQISKIFFFSELTHKMGLFLNWGLNSHTIRPAIKEIIMPKK
jgi:hypothetical protein